MTFSFDLSEGLKTTIRALAKKDKVRVIILNKKIKEIAACDEVAIDHYKNLRHELNEYKRAHIDKSFVLIFKVFKKENHILFERLDHHDKIYK